MKTAIFPGSFDPMTIGHLSLLKKAVNLFDKVVVAIGINSNKKNSADISQRIECICKACEVFPNVEVVQYDSLTTDLCHRYGAKYIVRGLRSQADFAYESQIADINRLLDSNIETVFLLAEPQYRAISSTMVRELQTYGKDVSNWLC